MRGKRAKILRKQALALYSKSILSFKTLYKRIKRLYNMGLEVDMSQIVPSYTTANFVPPTSAPGSPPSEEYKRGFIATAKIAVAVIISLLWWLAGRGLILGFRFNRRFWLPLMLVVSCVGFDYIQRKKYRWLYALMLPAYYISMSVFSYGADSWLRFLGVLGQRLVVGIMWAIPALPVAWVNKTWALYKLHIVMFAVMMVGLGAFSLINASAEEALIGLTFGLLPQFMIKDE